MLLSSGLLLFLSLASCQVRAGDQPKLAERRSNRTPAMVVNLHMPAEMKYGAVRKIIDNIQNQGANRWSLQVSNPGDASSAEIVADPGIPSDRIAAVVKELLDSGVLKISVEVKKVSHPAPLVIPDDPQAHSPMNAGGCCSATKTRKAVGLRCRR